MMKVVRFTQFGGPEVLEIVDLPDPHPGPGQVRIAVRAAGVDASRLVAEFPEAAALPAAIETATRALDQLGVRSGSTLLINGASGSVGSAAVQLAVVRGARVIGTASPANHEYLRSLGAERVLPAGVRDHVLTIADFGGAQEHAVRFSSGDAGRAVHVLAEIGELIESGRFSLPVAQTFPLTEIAQAHRVSEDGHVRGKLVLLVG